MCTSARAQKLSYRVAAEGLLIAEEKWILEALKKIKTQRNCLQIERLQLESMKAKLRVTDKESCDGERMSPAVREAAPTATSMEPIPTTSTVNLMQAKGKITSSQIIEFVPNLLEVEASCNEEALNLTVTNPVFNNASAQYDMENEEEEEFEELDDDVAIEMNMLMNGELMDE